jgi:DNA polymerase/3'-5' exonuclease PolX
MIGVIILIVVGITLIGSSIIEWNKDMNRIQELENRLDEYYKEREKRLEKLNGINTDIKKDIKVLKTINKSKGLIKRGSEWPE